MTDKLSPPKTVFCFHDPAPSGASLWLLKFLQDPIVPLTHKVVLMPGESSMDKDLRQSGITVHNLKVRMGALSQANLSEKPAFLINRLSIIQQYRRYFKRLSPNLIYVNSSTQIAPMIAAKLEGIPLFVHIREGWHQGRTHFLKKFAVRSLAKGAAFDAAAGMELFAPCPTKATWEVSPNGVDPQLKTLRKKRSAIRERLEIKPTEKIFLFLGTMCERKGVHDLGKVWPRVHGKHPHARLWLAGGLAEEEKNPLIRKIIESPPKGCRYLGYRQDIPELLAAADFFVLPTYGEAMPISISEAMMTGTPVIARNVADVGWQIGQGRGFLFDSKGPKELLAKMLEAYESPGNSKQYAYKAQEFASVNLTKEKQYSQIVRLMKTAAKS